MTRPRDVVVVGGGPAGLAAAIAAAQAGLAATVLERRTGAVDKACGEGLLPAGVRALAALGVLPHLTAADVALVRELRWIEPDGASARIALPEPRGLGIRRLALSAALRGRARALGVELVERVEITAEVREGGLIHAVAADGRSFAARLLVAADGLASPVRRREGLDRPVAARPRFGLRMHFAVPPWAEAVEVHFGDRAEAYVTPAGTRRVGVAILFERDVRAPFHVLLRRFPALARILSGAPPDSAPRGAGPFERAAVARTADRLVLLGDAAGYVDAVTGEGLSLAFGCALDLAALLPAALAAGASRAALAGYETAWRRRFRPYAAWTRLVLGLSRHPAVRRRVLALAAARPAPFERAVAAAVG